MAGNKDDQKELPVWLRDANKNEFEHKGTYPIHRAYNALLSESGFLASMGRRVKFRETRRKDLTTAGVRYDVRLDEFVLEYNSLFMYWMEKVHGISGPVFVMKHELYHLILGHVTGRQKTPHRDWNLGTDTIINLMCDQSGNTVPGWVVFPGRLPTDDEGNPIDAKLITKSMQVIASWDPRDDHSSEWYFNELRKNAPSQMEQPGQGCRGVLGPGGMDSHDWDVFMDSDDPNDSSGASGQGNFAGSLSPEDLEEYLNEKARGLIEKAVFDADNSSAGWGNMPADYQAQIRRMVSKEVDWKTLLKQFIGNSIQGGRQTSIKRINRKYPYVHPGIKRSRMGRPVVYIDQSGSVGNDVVEKFFAEIHGLTKICDVDVYPFDTRVSEDDVIHWRKGAPIPEKRAYCGGTDFDAPTQHANDPVNRGKWDGMLIITDGLAPKPSSSRVKRAWILAPGCTLNFDVENETVIKLDNDGRKAFGSWK